MAEGSVVNIYSHRLCVGSGLADSQYSYTDQRRYIRMLRVHALLVCVGWCRRVPGSNTSSSCIALRLR